MLVALFARAARERQTRLGTAGGCDACYSVCMRCAVETDAPGDSRAGGLKVGAHYKGVKGRVQGGKLQDVGRGGVQRC
eukprot:1148738-Pelagomonas_calceolata.AAC.1